MDNNKSSDGPHAPPQISRLFADSILPIGKNRTIPQISRLFADSILPIGKNRTIPQISRLFADGILPTGKNRTICAIPFLVSEERIAPYAHVRILKLDDTNRNYTQCVIFSTW